MLKITDAIALEDREIKERFVRAMGPNGQNSDRDATAVELRFDVTRSSLPTIVKERLIALGGKHVTRDGILVVVESRVSIPSAESRVRSRNAGETRREGGDGAERASGPEATSAERERRLASKEP